MIWVTSSSIAPWVQRKNRGKIGIWDICRMLTALWREHISKTRHAPNWFWRYVSHVDGWNLRPESAKSWMFAVRAFYHVMHYSAKRGPANACRLSVCPSVCLSVTLVDHDHIGLGWKSWKLIARTIKPSSLLFVAQRSSTYSQGNMEKFWETRWVGKSGVPEHKSVNIAYLKRVKIEEKLLWNGPIGSHQRSFEWYYPRPRSTFSSLD